MDTDNLNRWLTLGANIAVFASIMFLAVEVRQNQVSIDEANELSRLDARTIEIEQYNSFRNMLIEAPELLGVWNNGLADEDLSTEEEELFGLLCANMIWISAGSWERSMALDRMEAAAATVSIRAGMVEGSLRFGRCWQSMRANLIPYGLSDYVRQVENGLATDLQMDE